MGKSVARKEATLVKAIILLHEIYGKNRFMDSQRQFLSDLGFHVCCPDLLNGQTFSYEETAAAYACFYENAAEARRLVWKLTDELGAKYDAVYLMGYSAGAAIVWQCSENQNCAGAVAFYGSRIRDSLHITPRCPTLLLFAQQDSFDVLSVMRSLEGKANTRSILFPAAHGFFDPYGPAYAPAVAAAAKKELTSFLTGSQPPAVV